MHLCQIGASLHMSSLAHGFMPALYKILGNITILQSSLSCMTLL